MFTGHRRMPLSRELYTRLTAVILTMTTLAAVVGLAVLPKAAHAETYHVSIKNFSFNPQDLTVPVGSTVEWTNDETDGSVHSVTADDGSFSQDLNPGDKFDWTFDKPGSFGMHCRFHTYITGTVNVTGDSGSTTSTTSPPPSDTTTTTSPPSETTTTTSPPSETTTTTSPPSETTSTTSPPSETTSTTAPPSTTSTSTPAPPSDDTIIGGTVIPPVDNAASGVLWFLHDLIVALENMLHGAQSGNTTNASNATSSAARKVR